MLLGDAGEYLTGRQASDLLDMYLEVCLRLLNLYICNYRVLCMICCLSHVSRDLILVKKWQLLNAWSTPSARLTNSR